MILMREKCTSSRSRDRHGLFFMNKQRMCVWARLFRPDPDVFEDYLLICWLKIAFFGGWGGGGITVLLRIEQGGLGHI